MISWLVLFVAYSLRPLVGTLPLNVGLRASNYVRSLLSASDLSAHDIEASLIILQFSKPPCSLTNLYTGRSFYLHLSLWLSFVAVAGAVEYPT